MFLGRIIDGSAAGNLPIAQAYLTDIARNDKERTTNLGLIGAVFGVSFILGPLIGGVLGSVSQTFPFWFVGGLAFVNGILAIFFLPETHTAHSEGRNISINPFVPIMRALKNKVILPNYIAWFLYGLAFSSFMSIFALYTQGVFGFGQLAIGILFTAMGVLIAINQTVALKHFWLKYFKEKTLELFMLIVFAAGFFIMSITQIVWFVIGLVAVTFGQSVLRTVMNSQIAAKADQKARGEVLGITSSIMSLSMAIGPFIAGYLFSLNMQVPFILAGVLMLVAFVILYWNKRMPAVAPAF